MPEQSRMRYIVSTLANARPQPGSNKDDGMARFSVPLRRIESHALDFLTNELGISKAQFCSEVISAALIDLVEELRIGASITDFNSDLWQRYVAYLSEKMQMHTAEVEFHVNRSAIPMIGKSYAVEYMGEKYLIEFIKGAFPVDDAVAKSVMDYCFQQRADEFEIKGAHIKIHKVLSDVIHF